MVATRSVIATLSLFPASIATHDFSVSFHVFRLCVKLARMRFLHHCKLPAKPKSKERIAKREWFRERFEDRASLLEYMARAFLESTPNSERQGENGAIPYRITLHRMPEAKLTWTEGNTGPRYVPEYVLEQALCDAEVVDLRGEEGSCDRNRTASNDEHSTQGDPTWDARKGPRLRKTIPPTLRRKVLEQAGSRCAVPGCTHREFIEVHHITAIQRGGRNEAHNLVSLRSACHTNIHEGKLRVEGKAPGELVWNNRQGAS